MALNTIFPVGKYATNFIIANVETLSQDDINSHSFSANGHELGWGIIGHGYGSGNGQTD